MKRTFFAILTACVITVGLAGCGGDDAEIPDGHTADDTRPPSETPIKSPSADVGETVKGD